jgi:hypothetical protein
MSLSLDDLRGDLRENYLRIEEVLSGMDAYIATLEKRIAGLEGQVSGITAALYADEEADPVSAPPRIIVGR